VSDTLGRIYRHHRRGLFALALSITRSAPDAEDAVHDAFARMCRSPQPSGSDPAAYAFAAVRNAALDRLRGRRTEPSAAAMVTPCLDGSDLLAAERERDQAVAAAVDELPDDLRTAVFLRVYGGLTFRQIGELVDVPLQTIASRYQTALERLKPQLRKWL
jgi:RNA polymerase sigma-70 factor (ECF subfamily)